MSPVDTGSLMLDRRQILLGVVGGLFVSLGLPRRGLAQQPGIIPLNDHLSLVTTGGTNVSWKRCDFVSRSS